MVIKNSTSWSTDDIRKLFRRCVKEVEKVERPKYPFHKRNKSFKLDVLNGDCFRGRATIGGYWIMIKIPKMCSLKTEMPTEPDKIDEDGKFVYYFIGSENSWVALKNKKDIIKYPFYWKVVGQKDEMVFDEKVKLARLIIHEYYHTLGAMSIDHKNYKNDFTRKWNVDWVKDYSIGKKEIIQKPKADVKLVRYQRSIENFRKAETRLKRAKTLYKKWHEKVRYYEKVYNYKSN